MRCSSHNDKLLLVKALKKQGEVVAMIGSTFDDALALNEVYKIIHLTIYYFCFSKMNSNYGLSTSYNHSGGHWNCNGCKRVSMCKGEV